MIYDWLLALRLMACSAIIICHHHHLPLRRKKWRETTNHLIHPRNFPLSRRSSHLLYLEKSLAVININFFLRGDH
jgi:hypothetical protein